MLPMLTTSPNIHHTLTDAHYFRILLFSFISLIRSLFSYSFFVVVCVFWYFQCFSVAPLDHISPYISYRYVYAHHCWGNAIHNTIISSLFRIKLPLLGHASLLSSFFYFSSSSTVFLTAVGMVYKYNVFLFTPISFSSAISRNCLGLPYLTVLHSFIH